jgi:hypothetical protein
MFDMAGGVAAVAQSARKSVTLEGATLSGPATGAAIDAYRTAGGAYTGIYDRVGARLGTRNEAIILREIHRQYDSRQVSGRRPQDTASQILNEARFGPAHVNGWNTQKMAAQLVQLRRDNPAQAAEVERQVFDGLGNAGDQSRLARDMATAARHIADADIRLHALGADAAPPTGPVISRAALNMRVNELISSATEQGVRSRGSPRGADRLNIAALAYQVETIATANPRLAQGLRAALATRLDAQGAAELNRLVAGDTGFGDGIGRALAHPVDGAIGAVKGLGNGVLAVGDLLARGAALRAATEQGQAAGMSALFGHGNAAAAQSATAQTLRESGRSQLIPQIPYSNIAQAGGGDIGALIDVA